MVLNGFNDVRALRGLVFSEMLSKMAITQKIVTVGQLCAIADWLSMRDQNTNHNNNSNNNSNHSNNNYNWNRNELDAVALHGHSKSEEEEQPSIRGGGQRQTTIEDSCILIIKPAKKVSKVRQKQNKKKARMATLRSFGLEFNDQMVWDGNWKFANNAKFIENGNGVSMSTKVTYYNRYEVLFGMQTLCRKIKKMKELKKEVKTISAEYEKCSSSWITHSWICMCAIIDPRVMDLDNGEPAEWLSKPMLVKYKNGLSVIAEGLTTDAEMRDFPYHLPHLAIDFDTCIGNIWERIKKAWNKEK